MQYLNGRASLLLTATLFACIIIAGFGAFPMSAAADSVSAETSPFISQGNGACPSTTPANFTPYIYDGALHSFEFTIPDSSYVAVAGMAGDTVIPFQYMSRRVDPVSGSVRIHVDIQTYPIIGSLPLKVTMLSAKGGHASCVSIVSGSVDAREGIRTSYPLTYTPVQQASEYPEATQAAVYETQSDDAETADSGTIGIPTNEEKDVPDTGVVQGTFMGTIAPAFKNLCSAASNAYRLWLGLLIVFAALIGLALWAEMPENIPWMRTPEAVAVAILVGLLLLLGFWYFGVGCRSDFWMPLVATLMAILGILAAFRNHPRLTQILLLQEETR